MKHHYLGIRPDGSYSWLTPSSLDTRSALFRDYIGCSMLEQVHSRIPGIYFLVDECGKIKSDPQPLNPYVSQLYNGTPFGDPIVGPVVFVGIGLVDGPEGILEHDWIPLRLNQISVLSLFLGMEIDPPEEVDE